MGEKRERGKKSVSARTSKSVSGKSKKRKR